jgi:hypothetical protein
VDLLWQCWIQPYLHTVQYSLQLPLSDHAVFMTGKFQPSIYRANPTQQSSRQCRIQPCGRVQWFWLFEIQIFRAFLDRDWNPKTNIINKLLLFSGFVWRIAYFVSKKLQKVPSKSESLLYSTWNRSEWVQKNWILSASQIRRNMSEKNAQKKVNPKNPFLWGLGKLWQT